MLLLLLHALQMKGHLAKAHTCSLELARCVPWLFPKVKITRETDITSG